MSTSPQQARSANGLLGATAWLAGCFLLLPLLIILPISLTPQRYLSLPGGELSLRHYESLLTDQRWLSSIGDSLFVGVFATLLALVVGTSFTLAAWRLGAPLARWLKVLMLAPMIVPPIVHAVAFYRAGAAAGLIDTYTGLILVHAMKGIPFVILSVTATLATMKPNLDLAARSLGATPAQSLRWVILPQLTPGLLSGAAFAFVTSWDEMVVALFVTSRRVFTLPRRIWAGLSDNIDPAIAALGTIFVLATVAFAVTREFRSKTKTMTA
jgi:putative spermidine/putrescine transport system permease protein